MVGAPEAARAALVAVRAEESLCLNTCQALSARALALEPSGLVGGPHQSRQRGEPARHAPLAAGTGNASASPTLTGRIRPATFEACAIYAVTLERNARAEGEQS